MDSGFAAEHFELLRAYGERRYDKAQHSRPYGRLAEAYEATAAWAQGLKEKNFPDGHVEVTKTPLNRGISFWPYNWAKIYPYRGAPRSLAFTVGIDASGEFIVKIDTVSAPPDLRAVYEAERGKTFHNAPFVAVLSAQQGLLLSREELVAWSAHAIKNFTLGYDGLARKLGLIKARLLLLTDAAATKQWMAQWLEALRAGAIQREAVQWIPAGRIVIRTSTLSNSRIEVELGDDPSGTSWAVQINEPRIAGDHNSLSAVAVDHRGRHFLLRQGMLRPAGEPHVTISSKEFARRTGAPPLPVEASGLAAKRQWFFVAALDADAVTIRRMTGHFVDQCLAARAWRKEDGEAEPVPVNLSDLLGETGGSYVVGAKPAVGEQVVLRRHGIVWLALKEKLAAHGIMLRKPPRHSLGFEVDGVVSTASPMPLLVEIKTGISSSDIHAGVGQLHLYRKLLPELAEHAPVLLLPNLPSQPVIDALGHCGITVHRFHFGEDNPETDVIFDAAFLTACGVPSGSD